MVMEASSREIARAEQSPPAPARPALRPPRASQPPIIDGVLDDDVWRDQPLETGDFLTYNPLHGERIKQQTQVWMTYDESFIYFAFQCDDPEPSGIKTSITRRDNIWSDDWVGFSLDALGTGQLSYHFMANPSGVQLDMLNSVAGGEDASPDYVWDSAGRLNQTGYAVEMRVPLQSIRFQGGTNVRMGVLFWRRVSRSGMSVSWPALEPGKWVFEKHASLTFDELKSRLARELIPSATYSRNESRTSPGLWGAADDEGDLGLSGKYGLTSTVTLDATLNPDFSQVESDAFQVEVNQRFPIFFSEKRPFFMEGMGLFNLAGTGNGDGNMRTAVHTRRIVDPIYGSKLTGTAGKTTFGVLNAVDDNPAETLGRPELFEVPNKVTTVGRATYALRRSDYAGAIFTHTQFNGRRNLVAGGDVSVRPSSGQSVSGTFLATHTDDDTEPDKQGNAMQLSYEYSSRRWTFANQGEHYDRDFNMETAFYNRTGFTSLWSYGEVSFYPKSSWIQRIHPFYFTKFGHDEIQGGNEDFLNTGIRFNITRQGFLNFSTQRGHETWQGTKYRVGSEFQFFGNMQVLRWLNLSASNGTGPAIFYGDASSSFQGRSRYANFETTIQPNQHLSLNLEYNNAHFTRPGGELVYDVDIVNTRTTYQFDKHFLVRFLARYDSSTERILTDFLASYELVPGTVLHAGYGSLYERGPSAAFENDPNAPVRLDEQYRAINRGLFFKASYLHRF